MKSERAKMINRLEDMQVEVRRAWDLASSRVDAILKIKNRGILHEDELDVMRKVNNQLCGAYCDLHMAIKDIIGSDQSQKENKS